MDLIQRDFSLSPRPRGFHLITDEVLSRMPEIGDARAGVFHLFIRHTSASLTLNENASPDVRRDMNTWIDAAVPESFPWTHTLEGADDMPAHAKSTLTGFDLTLPVNSGSLHLGTWQGIYLCEHRDHGGARSITATVWGNKG